MSLVFGEHDAFSGRKHTNNIVYVIQQFCGLHFFLFLTKTEGLQLE